MSISIRYRKNEKITKCLSQLGMEKRISHKMPNLIRYGKNAKIVKCLSQLGMEKFNLI